MKKPTKQLIYFSDKVVKDIQDKFNNENDQAQLIESYLDEEGSWIVKYIIKNPHEKTN